jgi:hypothetical protein
MKATHTDYKHPRHLRVEAGAAVLCMAPSHSAYGQLNKPNLKSWSKS